MPKISYTVFASENNVRRMIGWSYDVRRAAELYLCAADEGWDVEFVFVREPFAHPDKFYLQVRAYNLKDRLVKWMKRLFRREDIAYIAVPRPTD